MNGKTIIAVEKSQNSKTGVVSATYAPTITCSSKCPFLNNGCYAQTSHTGMHAIKMEKNAKAQGLTAPLKLAQEEYKAISKLKGKHPLRLHVVGDCKTPRAAKVLSKAAAEYTAKGKQPVWTYTHSWREIPRDKWGDISVLASCETLDECKQAMARGYAASVVRLKPFTGTMDWDGLKMTACKELDKGIKCADCKLCFDDKSLLKKNRVVCFFPHGSRKNKAANAIRSKV